MTLRRRAKRRYLLVLYSHDSSNNSSSGPAAADAAAKAIARRHSELFGYIATERAEIKLVRALDGYHYPYHPDGGDGSAMMIVRCALSSADSVLATIALVHPPMVTLGMSGSVKRLRMQMAG